MPRPGATTIDHVTVQKDGKPLGLLVVMHPIDPMNMWQPNKGIAAENLMLGFVVPDSEIYASLYGAQKQIGRATNQHRQGHPCVGAGLPGLVLVLALPSRCRAASPQVSSTSPTPRAASPGATMTCSCR